MCASVHVFTLVATSTDAINSKAFSVLKLQLDVTKRKITASSKRVWIGGKRKETTVTLCSWIYKIGNCTCKAHWNIVWVWTPGTRGIATNWRESSRNIIYIKNRLRTLQIQVGQMKNIHFDMKESVYISGNVALAGLKSSCNKVNKNQPPWKLRVFHIYSAHSWNNSLSRRRFIEECFFSDITVS